jgi:hypothetical protein
MDATLQKPDDATAVAAPLEKEAVRVRFGSRLRKLSLATFMFLICGEVGCRLFWWYERGAPAFSSDVLWYAYYPQLRTSGVEDAVITNTDATYDVLILGGSTVSEPFGTVGKDLETGLEQRLGRPVRVYNLASAAHNTRDSLIKFRRLARQRFDLVVIYHGINDARMNNAPADKFRDDYSHCTWYKHLNFLESHPQLSKAALPLTLVYTYDRIGEVTGLSWFIPRHNPREATTEFGKEIRTKETFRRNMEEIVTAAKDKDTRVLLMTYAYHVPEGLSLDDSKGEHPDYAGGKSFLDIWGKPAYVVKAIDEHNAVVRDLAARHPETTLVDQYKLMPRSGKIFADCCHFTPAGCKPFVENMLTALVDQGHDR